MSNTPISSCDTWYFWRRELGLLKISMKKSTCC